MPDLQVVSDLVPRGDQPKAIAELVAGMKRGDKHQTLLGVTGSGKTRTMAGVIEAMGRPTLVMSPNKTLAAQLYAEFKEFFPNNAVEYFVSYYDYYQPEAYIPRTDTYVEKESEINEEINKLRNATTRSLFERRDVVIVASVSCIYGLGSPEDYGKVVVSLQQGQAVRRDRLLRHLVDIQYSRNDNNFVRGTFRVRGDTLDVYPAYEDLGLRIEFFGDEIERIADFDPLTGEVLAEHKKADIYPAKHFITTQEKLELAVKDIEEELAMQVARFEREGKLIEAQRIAQRTRYDIEMLRETGFCPGVENYSRHLGRRQPGETPWTLIDYFPDDFITFIDESHIAVPQIGGMSGGDRSRKENLVEYGFRLPSAMDNRPLRFEEFEARMNQIVYVSATPRDYEREHSSQIVEQIIRPTGLIDPTISVRPTKGQVDDLLAEVRERVNKGQRALITTLTKKMAEDLADYLKEMGVKTHYLHSDIETLERIEILRDLRLGIYDVVVGINLLREGLDLPEVSLVAIMDADKEGYLRSRDSLIQTIGRAARHVEGTVLMYADNMTNSMRQAIDETYRRRAIQIAYNQEHGIEPTTIVKSIRDLTSRLKVAEERAEYSVGSGEIGIPRDEIMRLVKELEVQMKVAAKNLEFEKAALLRDQVIELRRSLELRERVMLPPPRQSTKQHRLFEGLIVTLLAVFSGGCIDNDRTYSDLIISAKNHLTSGDYDEVIAEAAQASAMKHDASLPYILRGNARVAHGKHELALADYQEAVRLRPQDASSYFYRAFAYTGLGEFDKAVDDYRHIIETTPGYGWAYLDRGYVYLEKKAYARALDDFNTAAKILPNDALVCNNRGVAYWGMGQQKQALAEYQTALRLEPDNDLVYFNLAGDYLDQKNYALAISNYDQAIKLLPGCTDSSADRLFLGRQTDDYDRTVASIGLVARNQVRCSSAYVNRGLAYYDQSDNDKAIADQTAAIKLRPDSSTAYYNRGLAYQSNHATDKAIADFQKVVDLNNDAYLHDKAKVELARLEGK